MNRKIVAFIAGIALVSVAITAVTASSWVNTPLYTVRMEQASSKMNFLPKTVEEFTYTVENGYTLSFNVAGYDGVSPLATWKTCTGPTCDETVCIGTMCGGYTCANTCPDTCNPTCNEPTCPDTCPDTCQPTCPFTCDDPTCPWTCGDTHDETCDETICPPDCPP